MKLLTFTSLFPNHNDPEHGIFVYQRLAHFARRAGNSVHVVAPVPWAPPVVSPARYGRTRSIPAREQVGDLTVFHPRYPLVPGISMPLHGLLMFLGSRRVLHRLHAEHRFDLIDAHYVYPDGFAATLAGKMLKLPVVVSARGTDMNLFPRFRSIRPMIRWTLRHAAGGIGVCTPLRDAMIDCSLDAKRATVIGNGVDLSRFEAVPRPEARRRLSIPSGARVCLAIGALIPRKGFHFLLPAFARVAREGWPNVLLESLACGTPVVATSVWGVPEVITSAALGILVEQNVPAIAAGLMEALATPWDREALIAHARSRTWSVVAEELETFLEERLHDAAHRPEMTNP